MKTRVDFFRPLSRRALVALCVGAALAVLTASPGVVQAKAMSDADFVKLCAEGTAEQVKAALRRGAKVNVSPAREQEDDWTPLMAAARFDNLPAARVLLSAGADVNAKSGEFGTTALMHAAERGGVAVVRALLEAGAEVNAKDEQSGSTALMSAAAHNGPEVIRALLEAGADVHAQTDEGATALMNAANVNPDAGAIEALAAAGARVNERSAGQWTKGWTPLIFAARGNRTAVVEALLRAGADATLTDAQGHDALWHAREGAKQGSRNIEDEAARRAEDEKVIRLLEGGGADGATR